MQEAALSSVLYNNLAFYHLKGKTSQGQDQAAKYIEGAMIANKSLNEGDDQNKQQSEINFAISLNNKAVIELRRKNNDVAHEHSMQAVKLIESRVFGIINSGLLNDHKDLFKQLL